MKKIFFSGLLVLLVGVLFLQISGCHRKNNKARAHIGITLLTRGHAFYRDLEEGLIGAAAIHHFKLNIAAAEWDLAKQVAQIEDFIVQKVDAIVVCPTDSKGIVSAIERINVKNIPVFTADITSAGGKVISHIASDNIAGGHKAAKYMVQRLGGKGKVAIIDQPAVQSVIDRVKGFEDYLLKFQEIEIVAKLTGEGVRDKAMKVMEDILQSHPEVNAVFGINDDSALGALSAVEAAGRQDIIIIGYDATPEASQAILRGSALKADIIQYPKIIGETTINTIADFLAGKEVPRIIPIRVDIVDQASLQAANTPLN
jgi:ribose transport system substrate-binding protein